MTEVTPMALVAAEDVYKLYVLYQVVPSINGSYVFHEYLLAMQAHSKQSTEMLLKWFQLQHHSLSRKTGRGTVLWL